MRSSFREYLYPPGHPRLAGLDQYDACSFADAMRTVPVAGEAIRDWLKLFETTRFRGITTDGVPVPGLFTPGGDEQVPAAEAAAAAAALLDGLRPGQREKLCHPLDSKVWRAWMNPEFYLNRFGLRLEEVDAGTRERVLELVRTGVSQSGYEMIRGCMRVNGFLGELVGLPRILNEYSYNINLFGTPSRDEPWGWNLYGHHLCLNCLFIGGQQVLTPVFFGAEPNEIDNGEDAGLSLFTEHERAGLAFIRSLPPELAEQAILFHRKRDPNMLPGRLHPGDELHLGGAFQDNRVIPYEGLPMAKCTAGQREELASLVDLFLGYQPDGPRAARMADVRRNLDETWFCWIGGTGEDTRSTTARKAR